jgi:hypothetical protein
MVTPRTGRPRGRPKKDFLRDPERFAIPFAIALMTAFDASENDAFTVAAAELLGTVINTKPVGPRSKRGRGALPAGILATYKRAFRRGGSAAHFAGKASTLRKKANKVCTQHSEWCRAMSRAFVLALHGKDRQFSTLEIMRLAASVGEVGYARDVLLPLLAARFYPLPDFMPNVQMK